MFDTTDQILNQLRAGEDGLAGSRPFVSATAPPCSPNTEDLAGELVVSGKGPEYALFGDELRLALWARTRPHSD